MVCSYKAVMVLTDRDVTVNQLSMLKPYEYVLFRPTTYQQHIITNQMNERALN